MTADPNWASPALCGHTDNALVNLADAALSALEARHD